MLMSNASFPIRSGHDEEKGGNVFVFQGNTFVFFCSCENVFVLCVCVLVAMYSCILVVLCIDHIKKNI